MHRILLCVALVLLSHVSGAYSQEAPHSERVTISNGKLSVRAQDIPLRQLLDEIRQASGISLSTFPDAEAEMISATINEAPLEQGLRNLLDRYDSIFLYTARDGGHAELKK